MHTFFAYISAVVKSARVGKLNLCDRPSVCMKVVKNVCFRVKWSFANNVIIYRTLNKITSYKYAFCALKSASAGLIMLNMLKVYGIV